MMRLKEFERKTGKNPLFIRLGENHRQTFREEAQILTWFDPDARIIAGVPIYSANHPDDIIIDSEVG
jgi:hypothetical protein